MAASRKTYQAVADHLALVAPDRCIRTNTLAGRAYAQWVQDVAAIAEAFEVDNGAFDRVRFFEACSVTAPLFTE